MNVNVVEGNIFASSMQTLVNPVNCMGVMGAGLAKEFAVRYPVMLERYQSICQKNLLKPGKLWLYKNDSKWVLNFPTKDHWKDPSEYAFLEVGLDKFIATCVDKEITSVAFPLLGALNGQLDPTKVLDLMTARLKRCNIPVEIYRYKETASDDVAPLAKAIFSTLDIKEIADETGLSVKRIDKIQKMFLDNEVVSLSHFMSLSGVGTATASQLLQISKCRHDRPE